AKRGHIFCDGAGWYNIIIRLGGATLMNYYKGQDGNVYAYDDEQVEQGYPLIAMTVMSADEVDAHLNPPTTVEQLEAEQSLAIAAAKLAGVKFEGVMCSATKEDMWGLSAVSPWIQAGNSTAFEFDNGNVLV